MTLVYTPNVYWDRVNFLPLIFGPQLGRVVVVVVVISPGCRIICALTQEETDDNDQVVYTRRFLFSAGSRGKDT